VGNGFGVYFDPSKSTSGQRFFEALCRALADQATPLNQLPAAILFNVSAPKKAILMAKLRRQKVALRIDGLYFDRLSPAFLATFRWPLRHIFSLGLKYSWAHDFLAHLANLIACNYTAFARMLLADWIIYQSEFSQQLHLRFFPKKPHTIIVNGSVYHPEEKSNSDAKVNGEIRLATIYDGWRAAKRIHEVIDFVRWAREEKNLPVHLTILGYTGILPNCVPAAVKTLIETASYIRTLPRFTSFTGEVRDVLLESDLYITFTYKDPCPNAVVEAMAHGLPVVGLGSGGVPDIVGDAGILLPVDDFADGFFSPYQYECDFRPVDYEQMLQALLTVTSDPETFRARLRNRFAADLDLQIVANRYASVMNQLADQRDQSKSQATSEVSTQGRTL